MVFRFLIIVILLSAVPAYPAELCSGCHANRCSRAGSCQGCHRGNPAAGRKELAHIGVLPGRFARSRTAGAAELAAWDSRLQTLACRRCHTIGGRGNPFAADLDRSAGRKSPAELAAAIRKPVAGMPDFRLDEESLDETVTALLAASYRSSPAREPAAGVVHFDRGAAGSRDVFSRKCGGCHRALTEALGAIGSSRAAPDLSGLLTPYYPHSYGSGQKWRSDLLERWLKNPRSSRKNAVMPPVALTAAEMTALRQVFPDDQSP